LKIKWTVNTVSAARKFGQKVYGIKIPGSNILLELSLSIFLDEPPAGGFFLAAMYWYMMYSFTMH